MAEMERREQLEQKQQYADRQSKRFARRAKYSLDPDNKRVCSVRAEEWQSRAESLQKQNLAKIDFSNVKSISELEEQMRKITNKNIDLAGTDLELMKRNMEQLANLGHEYGYKFTSIEVTSDRAYLGEVSRKGRYGDIVTIKYPKKYYKNKNALMTELKKNVDSGSMPPIPGKNIDIYTTTHEFAHTLSEELTTRLYGYGKEVDFWDEIEAVFLDYKKNGNNVLGKYAGTNQNEFMAEAFANAKLHPQPTEWSERTLQIVDKYYKKSIAKSADGGIINKKSTSLPINIQLFARKSEDFATVILPKKEYGKVMHEIATHLTEEQNIHSVFKKYIGNYVYTVENNGFGNYRIIKKRKIK